MQRVTITISDELAAELTAFTDAHHYGNRSEAVRDLVRLGLEKARIDVGEDGNCVATLSYVLNHHALGRAKRLTDGHQECHNLQVLTTRVLFDHERRLEVVVLRGSISAVRNHAMAVIAERDVAYGNVSFVPVESTTATRSGAFTNQGTIQEAARLRTNKARASLPPHDAQ